MRNHNKNHTDTLKIFFWIFRCVKTFRQKIFYIAFIQYTVHVITRYIIYCRATRFQCNLQSSDRLLTATRFYATFTRKRSQQGASVKLESNFERILFYRVICQLINTFASSGWDLK